MGYTVSGEKVKSLSLAVSGSGHALVAQWRHAKSSKASGYNLDWEYAAKKNSKGAYVWLPGTTSNSSVEAASVGSGLFRGTWTAPDEAIAARVRVQPASKSREVKNSKGKSLGQKPYFTGSYSSYASHNFQTDKLAAPTVSVELHENGTTAYVTVESADPDCEYCDVQVAVKSGTKYKVTNKLDNVRCAGSKRAAFKLKAGATYYARARVQTTKVGNKANSSWSGYVSVKTKPAAPAAKAASATSGTSARFTWSAAAGASSYTVQYVKGAKTYFSSAPQDVTEVSGISGTSFDAGNLDAGGRYWFRVKGVNGSGDSAWSTALSCTTAVRPAAPTTAETAMAYAVGDTVELRFSHNAADGSAQEAFEVQLDIYMPDGVSAGATRTVRGLAFDPSSRTFPLPSDFAGAASVQYDVNELTGKLYRNGGYLNIEKRRADGSLQYNWMYPLIDFSFDASSGVATLLDESDSIKGGSEITALTYYSEHGVRTLTGATADSAPFDLSGIPAGAEISWKARTKGAHDSMSPWSAARSFVVCEAPALSAAARYGTADGADVDADDPLPGYPLAVVLETSGGGTPVSYSVSIEAAETFDYTDPFGRAAWVEAGELAYSETVAADGSPSQTLLIGAADAMLHDGGAYVLRASVALGNGLTAEAGAWAFSVALGGSVPEPDAAVAFDADTLTAAIEPACYAVDAEGAPTGSLAEGIELSVWRVDYDGRLSLLQAGIANDGETAVIDPHPTFGECWYHVVATDAETGAASFADAMDYSEHDSVVIQWDELWELGDGDVEGYGGERLDGFVETRIDETGEVEADETELHGREHPVIDYGSQLRETARYTMKFDRADREKLAKARRMKAYLGDVHVREPFGAAYWARARVTLSFGVGDPYVTVSVDATRSDRSDSSVTV